MPIAVCRAHPRRARMRAVSLFAVTLLAAIESPLSAHPGFGPIGPFTPVMCSACPTTQEVPFSYDSKELAADPNCVAGMPSPCPHYANWLDHQRHIVANRFVTQWGFYTDSMALEQGDCLRLSAIMTGSLTPVCGSPAPAWYDLPKPSGQSYQGGLGRVMFDTDASGTDQGFKITKSRVCCSQSVPL